MESHVSVDKYLGKFWYKLIVCELVLSVEGAWWPALSDEWNHSAQHKRHKQQENLMIVKLYFMVEGMYPASTMLQLLV